MSWRVLAACRGMEPDLFFPERGDTAGAVAARTVCARCPVREECQEAGMYEHFGIWGGLSERQRRALRTARAQERRAS